MHPPHPAASSLPIDHWSALVGLSPIIHALGAYPATRRLDIEVRRPTCQWHSSGSPFLAMGSLYRPAISAEAATVRLAPCRVIEVWFSRAVITIDFTASSDAKG